MSTIETHVVFIMDNSGSMSNLVENARSFVNEQIESCRTNTVEGMRTFTTFIGFEDLPNIMWRHQNITETQPLTQYIADGCTALYDAIALGIRVLDEAPVTSDNVAYLVIIVTDGQENASREFSLQNNGRSRIRQLIENKRALGNWTFVFMGSEEDTMNQAESIGIPIGNIIAYEASATGWRDTSSITSGSSAMYFNSRGAGLVASDNFYSCNEKSQ